MKKSLVLFLSLISLQAFGKEAFVDSPEQCLALDKYPCSVRSVSGPLQLEKGEQSLVLDKNSALHFVSSHEVQLLSGQMWLEKAQKLSFKVSPKLSIVLEGEFFAKKNAEKVWLKNLNGEVTFNSAHVFQAEALPVGFENWYGPMNHAGVVARGIIKPIELKEFLITWLPLAQNSVAELKKKVATYRDQWSKTAELSADFYKEVVERRMASVEAKNLSHQQQLEKTKKAIQKIRELYRQKNYLDPSEEAP